MGKGGYYGHVPKRDIIVMGGSAGSIEAIKDIVRALPADLPAALFVVIHMSPRARSYLASILTNLGGLPAVQAVNGQRIEPGHIYVAPPDRHLVIANDHIHMTRGPKEGLHRPSINVTFRSAAATYDSRVVGVLLSGMLDDGASGMWDIAKQQGVTIVQDPGEALFPSMPLNAIEDAPIQYKARISEMAGLITHLVKGGVMPTINVNDEQANRDERFTGFTCPECRGPLYANGQEPIEFHCRVGHVLPVKTLFDEHTSTQERKLYEAIVALEEGADLADYMAARAGADEVEALTKEAAQLRRHAGAIRMLIEERLSPSLS